MRRRIHACHMRRIHSLGPRQGQTVRAKPLSSKSAEKRPKRDQKETFNIRPRQGQNIHTSAFALENSLPILCTCPSLQWTRCAPTRRSKPQRVRKLELRHCDGTLAMVLLLSASQTAGTGGDNASCFRTRWPRRGCCASGSSQVIGKGSSGYVRKQGKTKKCPLHFIQ